MKGFKDVPHCNRVLNETEWYLFTPKTQKWVYSSLSNCQLTTAYVQMTFQHMSAYILHLCQRQERHFWQVTPKTRKWVYSSLSNRQLTKAYVQMTLQHMSAYILHLCQRQEHHFWQVLHQSKRHWNLSQCWNLYHIEFTCPTINMNEK